MTHFIALPQELNENDHKAHLEHSNHVSDLATPTVLQTSLRQCNPVKKVFCRTLRNTHTQVELLWMRLGWGS